MLFWQPVVSGKQHLQQFLRLKTAGALFDGAAAGDVARATRAALDAGETVEIAGYRLSSALARGLEAARLAPPGAGGALLVFEVGASEPPALSPAVQALAQTWRAVDWSVDARPVRGPAFWQTQEIEIVPGLIEATLAASAGAAAAAGAP
jgi:exosortase A-associated hydrolase 2